MNPKRSGGVGGTRSHKKQIHAQGKVLNSAWKIKSLIYIFLSIIYINFNAISWGTSSLTTTFITLIELLVLKLIKIFIAL